MKDLEKKPNFVRKRSLSVLQDDQFKI